MDIYIYFSLENEVDIDEMEDKIDEILGNKGEVTGSGMGIMGGNIDIEIYDTTIIDILLEELTKLGLPYDTYLITDGVKKNLY